MESNYWYDYGYDSTTDSAIYKKKEYADMEQVEDSIDEHIAEVVGSATDDMDTLGEIEQALGDTTTIVHQPELSGYTTDAEYNELHDKYVTLSNFVYSLAQGDAATPLNPDYVENNLSPTNTSVTITEGELGDVTIPEATKTYTVTAPMQDGATVTLSSSRAFNLINTSSEPVDVAIDAPSGTSVPTMSLSGNFVTLEVNNGSIGAKSGAAPLTASNVAINNDIGKNATISGVVFSDNATITSDNVPNLGVANNNTADNAPSVTINAENSTVTLNKGMWNELSSNVSADTLIVTQNAHINTLKVVKGNVIVNDREVSNRVDNVVNDTEYTVSVNTHHATTGAQLGSYLTGDPGVVIVDNAVTRGRITWGIFGSGNYLLDLNGQTVTISDTTLGLKTRNAVNLKIVDSVGGGKFISEKSYCLWAGENTTITIDVPDSTEIIGMTHTLYCEGSGHPTINVLGGAYKLIVDPDDPSVYDPNGNYKYMLNHYDATYTREGNCFNITGGKYYNFNPAESYGEPGGPVNLLPSGYATTMTTETIGGVEYRVYTVSAVG